MTMSADQLDKIMLAMEQSYADWEEEEKRTAHETRILDKLRVLPPDAVHERAYQLLRLQFSDAYFRGHPLYCGEEWSPDARPVLGGMLFTTLAGAMANASKRRRALAYAGCDITNTNK